ncbi:hypothetical protein OSB04_018481 [Centaurea solstitialis]|uniref:Transmembrane protein n=1 Tax=Centaurea solstitialis TaxID=347529 RepID=A0AA38WN18_9ASTR|nr:hypothetical protein OSB04_018481 [Centaurea solstitialis]
METPPPAPSLSRTGVISVSKRIVKDNYFHFIDLSFLFQPLAIAILITPVLRLSGHHHKSPIHHLLCILTSYILSLSAIAAVTFSTHNAMQGKPIKLFTSIKTLTTSFFPILWTAIVIHLLQFFISLAFLVLVGSIVAVPQNLGLGFVILDHENPTEFTWWLHAVIGGTLLVILVFFQANWSLAYPVVVAESKRGLAALIRSTYLVTGSRLVSLSLLSYYGVSGFLLVLFYTDVELVNGSFDLRNWPTFFTTFAGTCCLMMYMLMSTVGNTVLYMHCKALHEVDEQFAKIVTVASNSSTIMIPSATSRPPANPLSTTGILSESNRVLKVNYGHFYTLSLFFLPISFSIFTNPNLRLSGELLSGELFTGDHLHSFLHKPPLFHLLTLYILSLSAIATVTFTAFHGFSGKPIKLTTAIKSLKSSFFPLVSTSILIHILLIFISITFLVLIKSIVVLLQNLGLGFVMEYENSIYLATGFALIVINICFYLNWSLAFAIAVTESKWGFEALVRSSRLVKGMRSVSLYLLLYFVSYGGLVVFVCTDASGSRRSPFVFPVIFGSLFLMMMLLVSVVANTVLYVRCRGLRGELGIEVGEKRVCFKLDSDDEKVSHVVTVGAGA